MTEFHNNDELYVPFSQRTGLKEIPPQLKIGEVSDDIRRLTNYYINLEIDREEVVGSWEVFFDSNWKRVSQDFHVLFLRQAVSSYENKPHEFRKTLEYCIGKSNFGTFFDIFEFFVRHQGCSQELKRDLTQMLVSERSAYRVIDSKVVAVGTEHQGAAIERAISEAEKTGSDAARKHLINAGVELRNGDWSGSVRESINAVEAMARKLAPGTKSLGPALSTLDKQGYLHGSLRGAFDKLYGYSSDQEGIRHALVFDQEAKVDEADALFMIGACASFVSYMIMRDG